MIRTQSEVSNQEPPESGQDRIVHLPIDDLRPSPENDRLYSPIDPDDPEIIALSQSIRELGVQEPLIVTKDDWIVSGHRRHMAAKRARLSEVPCRQLPFDKDEDHDHFMSLLRECNRQRNKNFDEKLREEVLTANPEEAYEALLDHRTETAATGVSEGTIQLRGRKRRSEISKAKKPFLDAVIAIVHERQDYWPLSDRQIHYALLNDPPLKHASKPNSVYRNDQRSYKSLVDLLTRARLAGRIHMSAIADPTRPVSKWDVHQDVQIYLRGKLARFLKDYWRDLMCSQPNHIEIVVEKNTVEPILRPIAAQFTIPMTSARGFISLPPRFEIAERYGMSGKEKLQLLILSDFDPDGEEIAHSLARSLRDDFSVDDVEAIQVALTADQVAEFDLPASMEAKKTSSNYKRFAEKYGDMVFELEAISPDDLQQLLTVAIDAVIDQDAFNNELDQEKQDAAELEITRRRVHRLLSEASDN